MEAKNITVNISLAGEIDMDRIRQEFDKAVRAEIDRVGINVEVGAKKEQPLKVGDYAKVVGGGNFEYGDVVKIISDDGSGFTPLLCGLVRLGGDSDNECDGYLRRFKNYDDLVRATDEEVAEAKRKHAEELELKELERKWAKIGRKPNEFKAGDAIRYKNAFTTVIGFSLGGIRINQSNHETKHIDVSPEELTLVFPVESKFDGGDAE